MMMEMVFLMMGGCYDKVSADGTVAYRYKVTYKLELEEIQIHYIRKLKEQTTV